MKLFAIALLLVCRPAHAAELPALSNYLGRQIDGLEAAAQPLRRDGASVDPPAGLVLSDIEVEISPYAEFSLSGIVGVTITPEVDLVFTPPSQN